MALSLPQQRAMEAGKAFETSGLQAVQKALKTNYSSLRDAVIAQNRAMASQMPEAPPRGAPPAQIEEFNKYIVRISKDVLEDKSELAHMLRSNMQKLSPEEYKRLEHYKAIRAAGEEAVQTNTGMFGFLGGSTIMNALAGLIKWIFSGFKDGFQGLRDTIADSAVQNTVSDFKQGMQARGVDPQTVDWATKEFQGEAQRKAGMRGAPAAPPVFDLNAIGIDGGPAAGAPVRGTAPVPAVGSFDSQLGVYFHNQAEAIKAQIPETMRGKFSALLNTAEQVMTEKGKALAKDASPEGRALLRNGDKFNAKLMLESFREMQKKPELTTEQKAQIGSIITELEKPGATLKSAAGALLATGDAQKVQAGSLLGKMAATLGTGHPELVSVVVRNNPADQLLAGAEGEAHTQASQVATSSRETNRAIIRANVVTMIKDDLSKSSVRLGIDQAVQKYITETYSTSTEDHTSSLGFVGRWARATTNWVGHKTGIISRYAPGDRDRDKLATFVQSRMAVIVPDVVADQLSTGASPDTKKISEEVAKRLSDDLKKAIDRGEVPATWRDHLDTIKSGLQEQVKEKLDKKKTELDAAAASAKPRVVASLGAGVGVRPGSVTYGGHLQDGTQVSPGAGGSAQPGGQGMTPT